MAAKKHTPAAKKKVAGQKARVRKNVAASSNNDFWRVEININTLYWVIIGVIVVGIAIWTYDTNQRINAIYDSIDQSNALYEISPQPRSESHQAKPLR